MKFKTRLCALLLTACLLLPTVMMGVTALGAAAYVWEPGQALPRFSEPAGVLDAIDYKGYSFGESVAVFCLQGIVNRTQPRILLRNADERERDHWPDLLEMDYAYLADWLEGVLKYRDELNGLVVWNPDIRATANVATTVAGITDSLAVTPELAELLSAAPYSLPVVLDLRDAPITDKLSAYRYLYDNYRGQYTNKTISGLDGHLNLRDFCVAVKAPIIWLDAGIPAERALLKLFFDDTKPLDTFYTGWWPSEGDGISLASSYGVTTVPSDFYLNYTVYSAMSGELTIPTVPAKPALDDKKIYVCAIMSDGDNIQYDQGAMFIDRLWNSPDRGKMPIAWTASPVMLDAGPQILNYYYKTATPNDVLICGPSGLGYSTSFEWPGEAFSRQYGKLTNGYFERSAFNVITVWHELSGKKAEWFTQGFPSLLGLTTQGLNLPKIRHTSTDVPVIWLGSDNLTSIAGMGYEQGVDNIKKNLAAAAKLPQLNARFYGCQCEVWATGVSDFVRLRDELESEFPGRFEFVRPDHFMMLINEAYDKPYTAALQKTAWDSTGADAGKAFDGSFTTGWESDAAGEKYIEVALGGKYLLDRYVLKNAECNYLDSSLNTKAWRVEVSKDGDTWVNLDTVTGNTDSIVYRGSFKNKFRSAASYVRLVIDDPGADGIARVQELEIYGVKADDLNLGSGVMGTLRCGLTAFFNFFFEIYYRIAAWVGGLF